MTVSGRILVSWVERDLSRRFIRTLGIAVGLFLTGVLSMFLLLTIADWFMLTDDRVPFLPRWAMVAWVGWMVGLLGVGLIFAIRHVVEGGGLIGVTVLSCAPVLAIESYRRVIRFEGSIAQTIAPLLQRLQLRYDLWRLDTWGQPIAHWSGIDFFPVNEAVVSTVIGGGSARRILHDPPLVLDQTLWLAMMMATLIVASLTAGFLIQRTGKNTSHWAFVVGAALFIATVAVWTVTQPPYFPITTVAPLAWWFPFVQVILEGFVVGVAVIGCTLGVSHWSAF